jgi:hypothetical protein
LSKKSKELEHDTKADVSCHDFFDIVLLLMVPCGYVEIVTSKVLLG